MKNNKTFLEKISSGKGFYITAGLSVTSVIAAVLVLYATTTQINEDYIENTTTTEIITEQAENNVTNEADPRDDEYELENEAENEIDEGEAEVVQTTTQTTVSTTQAAQTEEVVATAENETYILPIDTAIIKDYSMDTVVYSATMGDWRVHTGVDFFVGEDEDILSVGYGTVTKVSAESSWGYVIEVDYGDFVARYCGMRQGTTVSIGTVLSQGDVIGKVDYCPCEASDDTHLHFEILVDGEYVDPFEFIG